MILADKIMKERKKCGWSQEELAEKLGVSRQAISKWEGAQSTPDLGRILEMARLFGVSTDYLLKDEWVEAEGAESFDPEPSLRRVSMEEANAFLQAKEKTAPYVALATFLCVLSPVCLLVLGVAADTKLLPLRENWAAGVGLALLLLFVAAAVGIFLFCGMETQPYEYLEKEAFDTEYGVTGMVQERKTRFCPAYTKSNIVGGCLCILSVMPLFLMMAFTEDDFLIVLMVAVLLVIAGVGAAFFVNAGIRWGSMQKLLQEGDYTKAKKKVSSVTGAIKSAYWLLAVALYLGYSFITGNWKDSWIVWPVAGVLFAAVAVLCEAFEKKDV